MSSGQEKEVRKLDSFFFQTLSKILDSDDSILSIFMGSIGKDLDDINSGLRFTSNDTEEIRNHAQKLRKSPSIIFLDEWSTMSSGANSQPKLRHLLQILVRSELFRAADYVAAYMNVPRPERPQAGPAAEVNIDIDTSDAVTAGLKYSGDAVNRDQTPPKPEIIAPNMNFPSRSTNNGTSLPLIPFQLNGIKSTIYASPPVANASPSISNLIKFSSSAIVSPMQVTDNFFPALSELQAPEQIPITVNSEQNIADYQNLPAISGLMAKEDEIQCTNSPVVLSSHENPQSHSAKSNSNIPAFTHLINGNSTSHIQSQMSTQSTTSSSDSD